MTSKNPKKPIYPVDCVICGHHEERPWHFSRHVLSKHGLKARQYTIEHLRDGIEPICKNEGCDSETRYCTFAFKDYCKEHSRIAEQIGGRKGGQASAWNKGETIKTDSRIQKTTFPGETNPFYGKKHTEEAKKVNADKHRLSEEEFLKRVSSRPEDFSCLSSYIDYRYRQGQKLLFQCLTCKSVIEHTLLNFERNPICRVCYPAGSVAQHEVACFVRDLGFDVIENDRKVLCGREIDILVPSHAFGIEFNGLYYHSYTDEDPRKDRHYSKTVACESAGIRLMHIFSDEWRDKRDIVKSMIAHRLGSCKHRIYARMCDIVELDTPTARSFLNATHLSGFTRSGLGHYGLMYDDHLVAVISFRRPRHSDIYRNCIEIARFATALDTAVIGGLGRLVHIGKGIARTHKKGYVMTYADRRIGNGSGYRKLGLNDIGWTGLDYWYNDGIKRYDRFKFRARDGVPEKIVAENAGVCRIYGCGSQRFILDV